MDPPAAGVNIFRDEFVNKGEPVFGVTAPIMPGTAPQSLKMPDLNGIVTHDLGIGQLELKPEIGLPWSGLKECKLYNSDTDKLKGKIDWLRFQLGLLPLALSRKWQKHASILSSNVEKSSLLTFDDETVVPLADPDVRNAVTHELVRLEADYALIANEANFREQYKRWVEGAAPEHEYGPCVWLTDEQKKGRRRTKGGNIMHGGDAIAERSLYRIIPGLAKNGINFWENIARPVKEKELRKTLSAMVPRNDVEAWFYYLFVVRKMPLQFVKEMMNELGKPTMIEIKKEQAQVATQPTQPTQPTNTDNNDASVKQETETAAPTETETYMVLDPDLIQQTIAKIDASLNLPRSVSDTVQSNLADELLTFWAGYEADNYPNLSDDYYFVHKAASINYQRLEDRADHDGLAASLAKARQEADKRARLYEKVKEAKHPGPSRQGREILTNQLVASAKQALPEEDPAAVEKTARDLVGNMQISGTRSDSNENLLDRVNSLEQQLRHEKEQSLQQAEADQEKEKRIKKLQEDYAELQNEKSRQLTAQQQQFEAERQKKDEIITQKMNELKKQEAEAKANLNQVAEENAKKRQEEVQKVMAEATARQAAVNMQIADKMISGQFVADAEYNAMMMSDEKNDFFSRISAKIGSGKPVNSIPYYQYWKNEYASWAETTTGGLLGFGKSRNGHALPMVAEVETEKELAATKAQLAATLEANKNLEAKIVAQTTIGYQSTSGLNGTINKIENSRSDGGAMAQGKYVRNRSDAAIINYSTLPNQIYEGMYSQLDEQAREDLKVKVLSHVLLQHETINDLKRVKKDALLGNLQAAQSDSALYELRKKYAKTESKRNAVDTAGQQIMYNANTKQFMANDVVNNFVWAQAMGIDTTEYKRRLGENPTHDELKQVNSELVDKLKDAEYTPAHIRQIMEDGKNIL